MSKYYTKGYKRAREQADRRKKATVELESIADEEKEEKRAALPTDLESTEIKWLQYLSPPKDMKDDLVQCRKTDEYNEGVYEHNSAMLEKVNDLLRSMGYRDHKLHPPPRFLPQAKKQYEKVLFDPNFRVLRAIEWLYEKGLIAVKDYKLVDGPEIADRLAAEDLIASLCEPVQTGKELGIDITDTAGQNHKQGCTCNNLWDGTSERCLGNGLRVRWKRSPGHHFLRPLVEPETY